VDTEDSLVAELLRDAGAIFYVKTNNPQGLLMAETQSFAFGRCKVRLLPTIQMI
jgi:amidase